MSKPVRVISGTITEYDIECYGQYYIVSYNRSAREWFAVNIETMQDAAIGETRDECVLSLGLNLAFAVAHASR